MVRSRTEQVRAGLVTWDWPELEALVFSELGVLPNQSVERHFEQYWRWRWQGADRSLFTPEAVSQWAEMQRDLTNLASTVEEQLGLLSERWLAMRSIRLTKESFGLVKAAVDKEPVDGRNGCLRRYLGRWQALKRGDKGDYRGIGIWLPLPVGVTPNSEQPGFQRIWKEFIFDPLIRREDGGLDWWEIHEGTTLAWAGSNQPVFVWESSDVDVEAFCQRASVVAKALTMSLSAGRQTDRSERF